MAQSRCNWTIEYLDQCRDPVHGRLVVGFSGGIDSTVLLHQLCAAGLGYKVLACHVNHGISPAADTWQAHCEQVCQALGVKFTSLVVQLPNTGNLEGNARRARYQAFAQVLQASDLLLLGQHLDDQIETALFHLLRGSGRVGLQGMPGSRQLGHASLLRPLLGVSREQIEAYARAENLAWVEDESNADTTMTRNYLRQQVIPALQQRWPDLKLTLQATLQRDAEVLGLLDSVAIDDLAGIADALGGVYLDGFASLAPARQKNLLSYWLRRHQLPYPAASLLDKGLPDLLSAAAAAAPALRWQGVCCRRHGNGLYLLRTLPGLPPAPALGTGPGQHLADFAPLPWAGGLLTWTTSQGAGLHIDRPGRLQLRRRLGGETLRCGQRKTLKNLLHAQGVPGWLRERLPLLFLDDELVGVAGVPGWQIPMLVASEYQAQALETGWCCEFEINDRYPVILR